MKDIIKNGFEFVKKNPAIVYSLFLVVAVTGVIFFNTYYAVQKFQNNSDILLQRNAVLAEDVFRTLTSEYLDSPEKLQMKLDELKKINDFVRKVKVIVPAGENLDSFKVIASTDANEKDAAVDDQITFLAWKNEEGIAFSGFDGKERYWNVTKVMKDIDGKKKALISFEMSLLANDQMIEATIRQVYVSALIALLIVLLIVANNARLLGYAVKVTKLQEVDKMKDDFISMASHELKSPLVALHGYVELVNDELKKTKLEEESAKEIGHYLDNMQSSVMRLNDLVNDLLEVSRLEQNRLPITIQEVEIVEIIKKIIDEMSVTAREKKLDLEFENMDPVHVKVDPDRVKQILINLISNAIKYTPQGKVTISAKEDKKFLFITVADTGLGISAGNLKNLFAKFYRVKTEKTVSISGTGLGLWISREIARKMDGDITVESIEGIGSHFILKLKKSKK
jgi:signal transduction histidine kinase